jgi:uncharacterized protein (DUF924 family)
MSMADSRIDDILGFWLEPKPVTSEELEQRGRLWFGGGPELDRQIKERFGELVEQARRNEFGAWTNTLRGSLALTLLLDQFPRHVYRGTPAAFASDSQAVELVNEGFASGRFAEADCLERLFLTLPYSHAEDLGLQRLAVAHSVRTVLVSPPEWKQMLTSATDFARKHLDVVARFGRFPHRNDALGRAATAEEAEYLEYLRVVGQWL